jgi:RNA polymerase sigma-70 factor (ECF subfamily)
MTRPTADDDLSTFESHRALLVAHAYRMLGDLGRAEDMVQEAWLRWSGRRVDEEVVSPRAYLVTLVTRLCLNELDSARSRHEESRVNRLPEPVDLDDGGIGRVDMMDQISMAFLVLLQRLTPAERAVLLLRDVFEFDYKDIAALVQKNEAACRKLLERAREHVASEKRLFAASPEAHRRLLAAFTDAVQAGDVEGLAALLAEDAVMITDGGPDGRRFGERRELPVPLEGAKRIAAFLVASSRRGALDHEIRELNGQPAIVFYDQGTLFGATLLAVTEDRIHRIFFHGDLARLGHLGPAQERRAEP